MKALQQNSRKGLGLTWTPVLQVQFVSCGIASLKLSGGNQWEKQPLDDV